MGTFGIHFKSHKIRENSRITIGKIGFASLYTTKDEKNK